MEPVIDLVAVSYQAPVETQRFLDSLQYVDVPFTFTVVDNNSPDDNVRDVLRVAPGLLRDNPNCVSWNLTFSTENAGYARACNSGATQGNAPYLALLNSDVEFTPTVVSDVVKYFNAHPDAGVVGPRTTDSDDRLTHAGILRHSNGRDQHRGWKEHDSGQYNDVLDVPTVSGATYFVRRATWDELTDCPLYQSSAPDAEGAFLPTQHFYEETFCSYHALAHGWRVVYLGTAHMLHQWHRSSPIGSVSLAPAEEYFRSACADHGIELTF